MRTNKCMIGIVVVALSIGWSPRLLAQDQVASAGASNQLEEIVVTAQKRAQNINDVGITMSAPSVSEIEDAGITDVSELGKVVSGFTSATSFTGLPSFSIRGINLFTAQISAAPAVSVYLDEAPLPYSVMTEWAFLDIDRVEVLKGPQGTLFGQNATGGSINIISAKPTGTLSEGIRFEVNNFDQVMAEAFVSGPLSDTLRARVAVDTTQFGAWQHGYYLTTDHSGDQDKSSGRVLLDWTPSDRIKFALDFNGGYDDSQPQRAQLLAVQPAAIAPGLQGYPLPTNAREAEFNITPRLKNHLYQIVLRGDLDISESATLTSISSYASSVFDSTEDPDDTAINVSTLRTYGRIETVNQELRLSGKVSAARLNYTLGVNYQRDSVLDEEAPVDLYEFSGLPPGAVVNASYDLTNRAIGEFANADFEVIPQLTVTGGVRLSQTRQTDEGCTFDGGNGEFTAVTGYVANLLRGASGLGTTTAFVPGGCGTINNVGSSPDYLPIVSTQVQQQNNFSFRGGLNFKPNDDTLLYGLVSRGYKAGMFPVQIAIFESSIAPVRQEELTDYEAGLKLSLLDHKIQLNVAGFYYDYLNKQFFTFVPVPPIGVATTIVNVPTASVKGSDMDVVWRPVQGLTLRGGLTYIKTATGPYIGTSQTLQSVNYDGKEFNFAPPWSATTDAEYRSLIAANLRGYVGVGTVYNDRTFADLGQVAYTRLPAFITVDARIGVESESGWRVGLWARNLTNDYYWTSVVSGIDTYGKFAGLPRTFGLSVTYRR